MLAVEKLHMSYAEVEVLRSVSLNVEKNEIISVVGSNGAGKTTLLRTISGLFSASSGGIAFLDQNITNMRPDQVVGMGLSHVPEGRHIFPHLSVLANLEMGAYLRKGKKYRNAYKDNLEFVFGMFPVLKERQRQKGGTLSGGEQQMLAIARALMSAPKLLMLDEPSMGLAPLAVREIFYNIVELNRKGLTVLLVEQDVEISLRISTRAYVMQLGKIALEGSGQELLKNSEVRDIYLGKRSE